MMISDPHLKVKPGLVREMVELIDRRQQSISDVYSIRDNSFSDLRERETTADLEIELQYMALDLSPYVSMDKANQIIEDIQKLSPRSACESPKAAFSSTVKTSLVSAIKSKCFLISSLLFIVMAALAATSLALPEEDDSQYYFGS
jgi:hypothetical protein